MHDPLLAPLTSLGLTESEVGLYRHLLAHGASPVGPLAKRLGRPRTTLYSMLARLHESGLIRENVKKGLKAFSAEPPDVISYLLSARAAAIETRREEFVRVLPELRAAFRSASAAPRLQNFEGRQGLHQVLSEMLLYADMSTASVWPIKRMMEVLSPEFFEFHNRERIKRALYTRAVWPRGDVVDIEDHPYLGWGPEFEREIRIAPEAMEFPLGYWIYSDKVAFLSSEDEGYGFIIQSEQLVATLMVQFELLWQVSRPLEFDPLVTEAFVRTVVKEAKTLGKP